MAANQEKLHHRHIDEQKDAACRFVLKPEDNDMFVRTGRQIINACCLTISIEVWLDEQKGMFEHIHEWLQQEKRSEKIIGCYAVPRGPGIGVFFILRNNQFDFDFADQLAVLNTELVRQFNVGSVEMHQLPNDEMDRFIVRDSAIEIYADDTRPHEAVVT